MHLMGSFYGAHYEFGGILDFDSFVASKALIGWHSDFAVFFYLVGLCGDFFHDRGAHLFSLVVDCIR
jgi:hypothetical protein